MFADYKYFYKYTLSDLVNDITTGIVDKEFNYISFSVKYKTTLSGFIFIQFFSKTASISSENVSTSFFLSSVFLNSQYFLHHRVHHQPDYV
jgi:hypothetical protein